MAKARILLVEDSRLQAKAAVEFLGRYGYDVVWAQTGSTAIEILGRHSIDLILMEPLLTDTTGYKLCRWLKQQERTRGIPVIMLTVKSDLSDKVAGLEAGADDYISKPYNEIELNSKINTFLRIKTLQDELRQKNNQLAELLKKVEAQAVTDPLTGLNNRRYFEDAFNKEFLKSVRYKYPFTCFLMDVDHFKSVNDTYGHSAGDSVLKEVSKIIAANIREVDHLARWGGEEFILALPNVDTEGAKVPASRIIEAVSEHRVQDLPPERRITISIGIACIPHPSIPTSDKLIQKADDALYRAKKNGRNRFEFHGVEA